MSLYRFKSDGVAYVTEAPDEDDLAAKCNFLGMGPPEDILVIPDLPIGGGFLLGTRHLIEMNTATGPLCLCLEYETERTRAIPPVKFAYLYPGWLRDMQGAPDVADILESLILAHACNGIDVTSEDYLNGINTTLEAYDNNGQTTYDNNG